MLTILKRYWATIVGGAALGGFLVLSVLFIGSGTVGSLVETAMKEKGQHFADLLLSEGGHIDAFLTGISRDADSELAIRHVAELSDIYSFVIFDRRGEAVFSSRSDRYKWLLRDRPGGIGSGDRLAPSVVERAGSWQLVHDDGTTNPSVVTPLLRDGRTIGFVSVLADMINDRDAYTSTLTRSSVLMLLTLLMVTGLPTVFFVRRQRKIVEADDRIQFLANHDPLTNLFNRTRMKEETDRVLATSRATREEMAFCFIDIDGLADINDGIGQAQGDELLRVVAERLSSVVDQTDLMARIGADDFVLLHRRMTDSDDLAALIRRIKTAVAAPLVLKGQTISPQISVGVALMPKDGRAYADLVKHSELALLHQKATRTGDFTRFEVFMDQETHRRREIEAKVRAALDAEGFELFYQPIVSGSGTQLLGFEALIRMPDGEGGYISPGDFIPIAEARGYIKPIGTWVIREAARQIALWPDDLFVAVNLSAVQFRDGDLVTTVEEALRDAGIPGRRLEIEVVESLLLERSADILGQLQGLKALGISIDMDDFGTGYSSLGYLWRFPFDKLKIDQSFMAAFDQGEANVAEIIRTIISLAHLMHMKVTAEGVETAEQVELLNSLGCDQLQGYHLGRPMPASRVAGEILARFRTDSGASDVSRQSAGDDAAIHKMIA